MAEDKTFEEVYPEQQFSELVWLSIKLACVLSSFERDRSVDTSKIEPAEAIQSA